MVQFRTMNIRALLLSILLRNGGKARAPCMLQGYGGKEKLCDVIRMLNQMKTLSPETQEIRDLAGFIFSWCIDLLILEQHRN